jgi:hypothetical protein
VAGNIAGLSSMDRNDCAHELSGTVMHLTSMAEWRATATTCDQTSLSGTPPTARQLLVVMVRRESLFDRWRENTYSTTA